MKPRTKSKKPPFPASFKNMSDQFTKEENFNLKPNAPNVWFFADPTHWGLPKPNYTAFVREGVMHLIPENDMMTHSISEQCHCTHCMQGHNKPDPPGLPGYLEAIGDLLNNRPIGTNFLSAASLEEDDLDEEDDDDDLMDGEDEVEEVLNELPYNILRENLFGDGKFLEDYVKIRDSAHLRVVVHHFFDQRPLLSVLCQVSKPKALELASIARLNLLKYYRHGDISAEMYRNVLLKIEGIIQNRFHLN